MAYQITFTKRFEKHFKDLNAQERRQLQNKLRLLTENPMHPSLRTKRIQGSKGLFECSGVICHRGSERKAELRAELKVKQALF